MGKGVYFSLGTVGAGGLGIGGLISLKSWQSHEKEKSKVITSIRDKYSTALLNTKSDDTLWEKKYEALGTYSPQNNILRNASSKKKGNNPNKKEIQKLLKSGCEEIYSSDSDNSHNFEDFKTLCSKTNENASKAGKSWISDATSENGTNKWDSALALLKSHDISAKWALDNTLSSLKHEIQRDQSTFTQEKRDKLKGWCDSNRTRIFKGKESPEFKSQEDFCKAT
ncbi:hypothetical protein MHC_01495 [Mycoplasma haemocanis str. Illinois]|uniref:Uncharacterized protein n=1 Tax=Mycoplasma haemocanis (strain Illinois) TaxID=1111676 RepID=H6N693_MYCHN|nr:hypothetical protein [Mycoplasma haemocanis]AEW45165.1 hypothetical protein MHC_01495 [Mycoplasma haemocanis str. Illinois]